MDRKDLLVFMPSLFLFVAVLTYALVNHMDLITLGLMLLVVVLACFTALFMIVVITYSVEVYGKRKAWQKLLASARYSKSIFPYESNIIT